MENNHNGQRIPEIIDNFLDSCITGYVTDFHEEYFEDGTYDGESSYYHHNDDTLGLDINLVSVKKNEADNIEEYVFETNTEKDNVPGMSFNFRYDSFSDKIDELIVRIYGMSRDHFLEISVNVDAAFYCGGEKISRKEYYEKLESGESFVTSFDYLIDDRPNRILIKYNRNTKCRDLYYSNQSMDILLEKIGYSSLMSFLASFIEYKYTKEEHFDEETGYQICEGSEYGVVNKAAVQKFFKEFKPLKNCPAESNDKNDDLNYQEPLRKYALLINGKNSDFRISHDVLKAVIMELKGWLNEYEPRKEKGISLPEFRNYLDKHNLNLPNLVFMGGPGTGKTTIARKFAENVLGADFYETTGGSLKAGYIGQTAYKVVEMIEHLRTTANKNNKPAVLFIDEAYNLFNNSNNDRGFSDDAIEILLKAMEPGIRTLEAKLSGSKGDKDSKEISVTLYGDTAVWLGGYEKDMRKALSANPGMYRRVKPIVLPTPRTKDLIEKLKKLLNNPSIDLDKEIIEENKKLCTEKIDIIEDYFKWASSETYAEFFGNYAGVQRFVNEIEKLSLLKESALKADEKDLESIIEKLKSEIRTQYLQVIERTVDRLPFVVYTDVKETFEDYIGSNGAKDKLQHVIDMICSLGKYANCVCPKGALLVGPPGTGKTFLAKCMAGELSKEIKKKDLNKDVAYIKVAATELRSSDLVKGLFAKSQAYDNVILFIDEIDAIGQKRSAYSDNSVLIQLLNEMDGFDGKNNIFVLAATNAPEQLDAALVRPGRFDSIIEVGLPNGDDRKKLVTYYLKKMAIINEKEITESSEFIYTITKTLRGYSPIEIKTILNDALILYYDCESKIPSAETLEAWFLHRKGKPSPADGIKTKKIDGTSVMISNKLSKKKKDSNMTELSVRPGKINKTLFLRDFAETVARREMGEREKPDKSSKKVSTENDGGLHSTAVHEVGHALVTVLKGHKFEKITILQRGNALGYVESSADTRTRTKQDFLDRIDICFGGRAAEEIVYGADQISGGAVQDIRDASRIARKMVMELGMNEKVGPIALEMSVSRYLGGGRRSIWSESTMALAEEEIINLLKERYTTTLEMLKRYKKQINKLADRILEKEEASYDEFYKWWKKPNNS